MVLTVTELTNLIKESFRETLPGKYKIQGEVSNCRFFNDHLFLTLKDDQSIIHVTAWNFKTKINIKLEDGNKVNIDGYLAIYPKGGYYQLTAQNIEVVGTGDIYEDYNILKEHYEKNGYFDQKNKKPLPHSIKTVGVITAKNGAALQDFLYVLKENSFLGKIYLRDSAVQGKNCPKSIENSIQVLDNMGLDIIIVTRGGGSFEDLNGFNDAHVIDAIYNAKTCIVSAIGHEVDNMLSDYVADIRVPTPSVAGELISKYNEIAMLKNILDETKSHVYGKLEQQCDKLINIKEHVSDRIEILNNCKVGLDNIKNEATLYLKSRLYDYNTEYLSIRDKITSNNPFKILDQGYCLVVDEDNIALTSACDIVDNKKLKLIFHDKEIMITVSII